MYQSTKKRSYFHLIVDQTYFYKIKSCVVPNNMDLGERKYKYSLSDTKISLSG